MRTIFLLHGMQMPEPMIDERHFLLQSPTKSLGERQQLMAQKPPGVPELLLGKAMLPLPAPMSYSLSHFAGYDKL